MKILAILKKLPCFILVLIQFFLLQVTAVSASSPDKITIHEQENLQALLAARNGIKKVIAYMDSQPYLFPAQKENKPRFLSRDQRLLAWQTWQTFLDYLLTLDHMGQAFSSEYRTVKGKKKKEPFYRSFACFLIQYRYAMAFIERTERDPSFHIMLNEPVPELGLEKGSYSKIKYRFLNVLRGAEFARLSVVYKFYAKKHDTLLHQAIKEDSQAIWLAGQGKGPAMTAQNALKIVEDLGMTTWFPIQKGIAEMMGEVKVWRPGKSLISSEKIASLREHLQPGDIILVRRDWYLTVVGISGFWTHAALYVGDSKERTRFFDTPESKDYVKQFGVASGQLEDLLQQKIPKAYKLSLAPDKDGHLPLIVEAVGEGVSFSSLEHGASADSLVILRPRLAKTDKALAILRAFHYSGRPYDFNFDFLTDSALVCSELIFKSYESSKKTKGLSLPLNEIMGRKITSPNDIARQFDEEYDSPEQQLDFVLFLDGKEAKKTAMLSDLPTFRKSWLRPKWHVIIQDTPLQVYE